MKKEQEDGDQKEAFSNDEMTRRLYHKPADNIIMNVSEEAQGGHGQSKCQCPSLYDRAG